MAETDSSATGNRNHGYLPHCEALVVRDAVNLDVSWLLSPDLPAIDVIARLHVVACRRDRQLWLHGATCELIELLELVGLRDIMHLCPCGHLNADHLAQRPPRS
jgi:hypothetical protein